MAGSGAHLRDYKAFPKIAKVLQEYSVWRAGQVQADKDLKSLQVETRYLVWRGSGGAGLGNRIISIAACFALALVTKRVLLLKDPDGAMIQLFKEPFHGGSWLVRPEYEEEGRRGEGQLVASLELSHLSQTRDFQTITCEDPRDWTSVKYIVIDTCQYFVPLLFSNPTMRHAMEELFPDHRVFTPLVRFLFQPIDRIMEAVLKINADSAQKANGGRVIGLQLREFNSKEESINSMDRQVQKCINQHLPFTEGSPHQNKPAIYIAALKSQHHAFFKKEYSQNPVCALPTEDEQKFNQQHMEQAIKDIWVLSLATDLIVSPWSTFGYVAAGLRNEPTYRLTGEGNTQDSCVLVRGGEPCYHQTIKNKDRENLCGTHLKDKWPSYMEVCDDCTTGMRLGADPHPEMIHDEKIVYPPRQIDIYEAFMLASGAAPLRWMRPRGAGGYTS